MRQATMLDLLDMAADAQRTHEENQGQAIDVEESVSEAAESMHIHPDEMTGTQLDFVEASRKYRREGYGGHKSGTFSNGKRFRLDTEGRDPKFRFG